MAKIFNIKGINITISDKAVKDYKEKILVDLDENAVGTYVMGYILDGERDPEKLSKLAEERLYDEISTIHFQG